MLRGFIFTTSFCAAMSTAAVASGHIRLDYPEPRDPNSSAGPCGGGQRAESFSLEPEFFEPGAVVPIRWTEVISHAGATYSITLASSDVALAEPDGTVAGGILLVANIPSEEDREYEVEVTLPLELCEACTIQVIQLSGANYYQCADITIGSPMSDLAHEDDGFEGGCSISKASHSRFSGTGLLVLVGVLAWRRRHYS
jgi:MYXO-CTERM domain-containing protein